MVDSLDETSVLYVLASPLVLRDQREGFAKEIIFFIVLITTNQLFRFYEEILFWFRRVLEFAVINRMNVIGLFLKLDSYFPFYGYLSNWAGFFFFSLLVCWSLCFFTGPSLLVCQLEEIKKQGMLSHVTVSQREVKANLPANPPDSTVHQERYKIYN